MLAHLRQEPLAEVRGRLDDAAADEVGVGIREVGGDREEPADRLRLLGEDRERHRVALLAVAPHELGRLRERLGLRERVLGVARQPVRQQVLLDPGERGDALGVAARSRSCTSAAAGPGSSSPCSGMWTWPSSPAKPEAPLITWPFSMTPPPKPVPMIAETEARCGASGPNSW